MKFRIRTRIVITYLLLIVFSMSILGTGLIILLEKYFTDKLENQLEREGYLVSSIIYDDLLKEQYSDIDNIVKNIGKKLNTRITIILADGMVVADSNYERKKLENHINRQEVQEALQGKTGIVKRFSRTVNINNMYVALPIKAKNSFIGVVRLSLPLTEINKTLFSLTLILITTIFIATSIGVLLSIRLSKTIIEPIKEISKIADKIAKGDLKQKIFCPTQDELGALSRSINVMTTSLKEKIIEITSSKNRIEAILNNISSGVLVINKEGIVQELNPQVEKIFGVNKEKIIGENFQKIIRNYDFQESIEKTVSEKVKTNCELAPIYPGRCILEVYITPIIQENKVRQVAIIFHDITSIRQVEKMKSDFIANASHELRTPITAIKGFSETLLSGAMEEKALRERFIGIIDKEAERLCCLTNDLLDLSQLERRNKEIDMQEEDITSLLKVCSKRLETKAINNEININLDIANDLPKIKINKNSIYQVIINLIDNGIKYNKKGGILNITAKEEGSYLLVSFKDTGIGISKEELPRIFERFYRVDKARSKEIGGTGLGLSIVKHILDMQKVKISVESQLDKGTMFTLYFKLKE
ncbi:two-component system, OmpR family, phosphate regulon sensor histidine kinase PhoR [Desulfonispora thiosulfatigenes DSM 11270]|uniref:histidine kinase n=1 Tax=Desulfonispora thiosulfatigenes DSM 11270 TaxID=656914 RepID=A0A1W1VGW6_DESTI|nr:ATP-binding protein [Desulfonispora thiosulfatigenes]SMB92194.1 two-component system, OmpR family, phosphate regulon sensor histidine kinase PhoR [Desulfonispora thiosulfatigenes DSM 11270]